MKLALTLGAALFGLTMIAAPASAMPTDRSVKAPSQVEDVAYGCGRGMTRARNGLCRPYYSRRYRQAPNYRRNMRERADGCQYIQTPSGVRYRCK